MPSRQLKGLTLQNRWDSAACHEKLALSEPARLIVQFIGEKEEWRSVLAERPIPKGKFGIFYYEVTIFDQKFSIHIGLATIQTPLDKRGLTPVTSSAAAWIWQLAKSFTQKMDCDWILTGCMSILAPICFHAFRCAILTLKLKQILARISNSTLPRAFRK
uniref:Uncharacterized protein n=1 Tax=Globodera rostochiensis TaxID=31243 RepID=A0A914H9D2_GLORO